MNIVKKNIDILHPKRQKNLFHFSDKFNFFVNLINNKKMPQCTILSGNKGIGKSTLVYHLSNFILSKNEEFPYSRDEQLINENNVSYKSLNENIHPNFFVLENESFESNIKIDRVRNLIKFVNMTSLSNKFKIILIDNAEYLNINSSNALLKIIEEPPLNTFFFIIHNNNKFLLNTIKSRCIKFNLNINIDKKKKILVDLFKQYKINANTDSLLNNLYFDSPGNLLKIFSRLYNDNIDLDNNKLNCILYFIDSYKKNKNTETLSFLSLLIEAFYNELCLKNSFFQSSYYYNKNKIVRKIHDMKKLNLDEKNIFIGIKDTLLNEKR